MKRSTWNSLTRSHLNNGSEWPWAATPRLHEGVHSAVHGTKLKILNIFLEVFGDEKEGGEDAAKSNLTVL